MRSLLAGGTAACLGKKLSLTQVVRKEKRVFLDFCETVTCFAIFTDELFSVKLF